MEAPKVCKHGLRSCNKCLAMLKEAIELLRRHQEGGYLVVLGIHTKEFLTKYKKGGE